MYRLTNFEHFLGIGEASAIIMERVYTGKIDPENLDWINKIVEGKMGMIVKKMTEISAGQQGKINPAALLKILAKEMFKIG